MCSETKSAQRFLSHKLRQFRARVGPLAPTFDLSRISVPSFNVCAYRCLASTFAYIGAYLQPLCISAPASTVPKHHPSGTPAHQPSLPPSLHLRSPPSPHISMVHFPGSTAAVCCCCLLLLPSAAAFHLLSLPAFTRYNLHGFLGSCCCPHTTVSLGPSLLALPLCLSLYKVCF